MQNLTVHLGSATPLSSRAGPRAPTLSTAPADRPAPPVSGTTAQHYAVAHLSVPSLPALYGWHARAAHIVRERHARAAAGRKPPEGARPQGTPVPCGTPTPGPPPHLFPPLFSFPLCRADDRAAQVRPRRLILPSPLLSDPSSRAPELPHRSPHPDRHLRPPAAPSPSRIPAEHRRRPPLPGELLPELPIPEISCKSLTPLPLPSYRTSSLPPATTGAPSPPTNAAARRRLPRLTVDPPFRCAPAHSSFPGTLPVTPSRSPATPYRRRATAEPPVSTPLRRPARAQQAAQASCPAGLGCQAVAQPVFQPPTRGRPPHPVGSSLGPVLARYCGGDFKYFSNCF
jgi:hypothetical protein